MQPWYLVQELSPVLRTIKLFPVDQCTFEDEDHILLRCILYSRIDLPNAKFAVFLHDLIQECS